MAASHVGFGNVVIFHLFFLEWLQLYTIQIAYVDLCAKTSIGADMFGDSGLPSLPTILSCLAFENEFSHQI